MKKSLALQIIRKTKQDYNAMAVEWDKSRFLPSKLKLKQLDGLKPGMQLLDLGCGNGFLAPYVLEKGAEYVGVDFSSNLIKVAKKKYQAKFLVLDAVEKWPFKSNSFDRIISFAVLHHIPPVLQPKVLEQTYKVLKPGGKAIFINWNLLNSWSNKRFGIEALLNNPAQGMESGDVLVPWKATSGKLIKRYLHISDSAELKLAAKKIGFKKISAGYYNRAGEKEKNGEEFVLKLSK